MERLDRLSAWLGAEVWVKRDDLTGLALSGNKVRKLEYHLAEALAAGCDTVITCGGLQSNHCRATAFAARRLGLEPILLLRGTLPEVPDGNLLLDHLAGARIVTCSPETYRRDRDVRLAALAEEQRAAGRRPWVIPEGGSDALGARGFVAAARELRDQATAPFDAVVCALGSGGTLAGLAAGVDLGPLVGVAVCDDAAWFTPIVSRIAETLGADPARWQILEGYQGPGYAVAEPVVWDLIARLARTEGLLLDPVYTGKAMHGLVGEVRAGRLGGRLLFWHTGGAFGLFGRGREVAWPASE